MTTLTPDSPIDLALRAVARQAAEHATAKEQDPLQRLWANVANTTTFLAKVARKLPPGMTARHLGLAVLVVQEQRSTDQPQRALHRLICRAIMTLLQESGAAVPGTQQDAARALHLWAILQALVMQQAAQTQAPQVVTPGVDPDQVLEQKQRGLMTLREMLLIDMIEMSGQMVMMLAPPAEPAQCQRCSECQGAEHHWLPVCPDLDAGDAGPIEAHAHPGGRVELRVPVRLVNGREALPRWECKHCPATMPYDPSTEDGFPAEGG